MQVSSSGNTIQGFCMISLILTKSLILSNLILAAMVCRAAYQDVILSGEFTYRKFVQFVIDSALSTSIDQVKQTGLSVIWQSLFYLIMKIADWFTVPSIWLLWKFIPKCVWDMRRKAKLGVKLMEPPNILN